MIKKIFQFFKMYIDKPIIQLANKNVYNIKNNTITTKFNTINNPYEIVQTGKFIIYTCANKGNLLSLYLLDIEKNTTLEILSDSFIKYNPVVNNYGDFAYALSKNITSISEIYINDTKLSLDKGLYRNLSMNNDFLIFSDSKNNIYLYNLQSKVFSLIPFHQFIEKLYFISNEKILVQYFSSETNSMNITSYNIYNQLFKTIATTMNDTIIKYVQYNKKFILSEINNNEHNIKLLFNSLYSYYGNKISSPFSKMDNSTGRIGWNQSEQLEEILSTYLILKDKKILLQIELLIKTMLKATNKNFNINDEFNSPASYSTTKYSLNGEHISFLVHDSKIYYAMLRCINEIPTFDTSIKKEVIRNTSIIYTYYEKYFDHKKNLYRFQYGMPYKLDGLYLPYNMQNSFALMLLELFKSSKLDIYEKRVLVLAKQFKKEFFYQKEKVIWHYMPLIIYKGWTEADKISLHMPFKKQTQDNNFEDTGHAALNVKFIVKFFDVYPNLIFTNDDMLKLKKTLSSLQKNNMFSRHLNVNSKANKFINSSFLKGGWALLKNEKLKASSIMLTPSFLPDFDTTTNHYIDNINTKKIQNENLLITERTFNTNITEVNNTSTLYTSNTIQKYFHS